MPKRRETRVIDSTPFTIRSTEQIVTAVAELTQLVMMELEKRREILTDRICEAIGGVDNPLVRRELNNVTRYSKLLNTVERLRPSPLLSVKNMPPEDVIRSAETVLKDLETLKVEIGKEI